MADHRTLGLEGEMRGRKRRALAGADSSGPAAAAVAGDCAGLPWRLEL